MNSESSPTPPRLIFQGSLLHIQWDLPIGVSDTALAVNFDNRRKYYDSRTQSLLDNHAEVTPIAAPESAVVVAVPNKTTTIYAWVAFRSSRTTGFGPYSPPAFQSSVTGAAREVPVPATPFLSFQGSSLHVDWVVPAGVTDTAVAINFDDKRVYFDWKTRSAIESNQEVVSVPAPVSEISVATPHRFSTCHVWLAFRCAEGLFGQYCEPARIARPGTIEAVVPQPPQLTLTTEHLRVNWLVPAGVASTALAIAFDRLGRRYYDWESKSLTANNQVVKPIPRSINELEVPVPPELQKCEVWLAFQSSSSAQFGPYSPPASIGRDPQDARANGTPAITPQQLEAVSLTGLSLEELCAADVESLRELFQEMGMNAKQKIQVQAAVKACKESKATPPPYHDGAAPPY